MGNLGGGQPWSTVQAPINVLAEADLASLPTRTYESGTLCTVNDPASPTGNVFVWIQGSTAGTVSGISVAASGGAWISASSLTSAAGSIAAQSQAVWAIDGTNGLDTNPGTAAAPIKTHAEFRRRIGFGPMRQNTSIAIVNGLGAADSFDTFYDTGGFLVTYTGTPTVVNAGRTASAYTPRVVATNTPNQLTDSAALVWTPFLGAGNFIRMTSGAAIGLLSTVAKDQGAGVARVGTFLNASGTEVQPGAADTYEIILVPTISATCRVKASQYFQYNQLKFGDFFPFATDQAPNQATAAGVGFAHCSFNTLTVRGAQFSSFLDCQVMNALTGGIQTQIQPAFSCAFLGGVFFDATNQRHQAQGRVLFRRGTLFQGTSIACFGGQGVVSATSYLTAQDVGFFDTVLTAVDLREGSAMLAQTIWGNTGAGNPGACTLDRSSKLYLLGATQTLTNAAPTEIVMPLTAATTWAAARAASGVKDGATSDASIMVVN